MDKYPNPQRAHRRQRLRQRRASHRSKLPGGGHVLHLRRYDRPSLRTPPQPNRRRHRPEHRLQLRGEPGHRDDLEWGAQGIFTYTWDDNFFLAGLELASGADTVTVPFSRDLDGAITDNAPFAVTRDGPLRLPSGIGDGALAITYAYDSLGRVASRTHTVDGQEAYQVGFTYDNLGRIGQKIETIAGTTHTYDYAYDVDGQLTEVQRDGAVVEDYSYDLNGNRTSTFSATASYDTQDRLTELGGVTYTFDADGFLTQRGSDTFTYSARGELLSASVDGQTITYTYDGLSRRVGRTDTSGTHQYLYGNPGNPFQVTAVREPAGTLHHLLLRRGRTALRLVQGRPLVLRGQRPGGHPPGRNRCYRNRGQGPRVR